MQLRDTRHARSRDLVVLVPLFALTGRRAIARHHADHGIHQLVVDVIARLRTLSS
jgi:hypothetical protein